MHNTIIGDAAGKIWAYLDKNGSASVTKITNETGVSKSDIQRAIGWLLKEDKLSIEVIGRIDLSMIKKASLGSFLEVNNEFTGLF